MDLEAHIFDYADEGVVASLVNLNKMRMNINHMEIINVDNNECDVKTCISIE